MQFIPIVASDYDRAILGMCCSWGRCPRAGRTGGSTSCWAAVGSAACAPITSPCLARTTYVTQPQYIQAHHHSPGGARWLMGAARRRGGGGAGGGVRGGGDVRGGHAGCRVRRGRARTRYKHTTPLHCRITSRTIRCLSAREAGPVQLTLACLTTHNIAHPIPSHHITSHHITTRCTWTMQTVRDARRGTCAAG